jgi:hypothetical protein
MAADPMNTRRAPIALSMRSTHSRKARAEAVAQRQREAEVLTGLKTEQGAAAANARLRLRRHVRGSGARRNYGAGDSVADTGDGAVLRSACHSADGGGFGPATTTV